MASVASPHRRTVSVWLTSVAIVYCYRLSIKGRIQGHCNVLVQDCVLTMYIKNKCFCCVDQHKQIYCTCIRAVPCPYLYLETHETWNNEKRNLSSQVDPFSSIASDSSSAAWFIKQVCSQIGSKLQVSLYSWARLRCCDVSLLWLNWPEVSLGCSPQGNWELSLAVADVFLQDR